MNILDQKVLWDRWDRWDYLQNCPKKKNQSKLGCQWIFKLYWCTSCECSSYIHQFCLHMDFKDGYKFQWTLGTKHRPKSFSSHQSPLCHSREGPIEQALVNNTAGVWECIQSNGPLFSWQKWSTAFPRTVPSIYSKAIVAKHFSFRPPQETRWKESEILFAFHAP